MATSIGSFNRPNQLTSCRVAMVGNLAGLYNNGPSNDGVKSTLTNNGSLSALVIDGITMQKFMRVLLPDQNTNSQNGLYIVTNVGSTISAWVLQRVDDFQSQEQMKAGYTVSIEDGTNYAGDIFTLIYPVPQNVGIDAITFVNQSGNTPPSLDSQYWVDIQNGNDIAGAGGILTPWKTIPYALANLPVTPSITNKISLNLNAGIYPDNFSLPANVFIIGPGNWYQCQITGTVDINNSTWNNIADNRSGFCNIDLRASNTYDFTAQTNNINGNLRFFNCQANVTGGANQSFVMNGATVFTGDINFIVIGGSSNMAVTAQGGFLQSFNSTLRNPTINQAASLGGFFTMVGGAIAGSYTFSTGTLTINGGAVPITAYLSHNNTASSSIVASGAATNIYAISSALPVTGNITLTTGATITKLTDGYSILPVFPSLQIASGAVVSGILGGSGTLDFPSIASQTAEDLTISVTGARANNQCILGLPAAYTAGLVYNAFVSANDVVTVRCSNVTAGAIDPASATFKVTVIQT